MPRHYDDDQDRLPDGMVRVGYDADTQVYTFRDTDGSLWEGPPGCEYGHLTKVANAPKPPAPPSDLEAGGDSSSAPHEHAPPPSYDESEAAMPFLNHAAYNNSEEQWRTTTGRSSSSSRYMMAKHWRAELMPLLNFFMILALFLVGLFWFLGWMTGSSGGGGGAHSLLCGPGAHAHKIQAGETCWGIAQMHAIDVEQLREANGGLNCDLLRVGAAICVPAMPKM